MLILHFPGIAIGPLWRFLLTRLWRLIARQNGNKRFYYFRHLKATCASKTPTTAGKSFLAMSSHRHPHPSFGKLKGTVRWCCRLELVRVIPALWMSDSLSSAKPHVDSLRRSFREIYKDGLGLG
jgi:hypothetical protein